VITTHSALRDRLLRQRRDRLARNGTLGPTIKALHDLVTLMELSRLKIYRRGQQPTSFLLIMQSCYGPLMWWDAMEARYCIAPLRTHRAEREAADDLLDKVIKALGTEYGQSIAEVLATADRMAAAAMSSLEVPAT